MTTSDDLLAKGETLVTGVTASEVRTALIPAVSDVVRWPLTHRLEPIREDWLTYAGLNVQGDLTLHAWWRAWATA